MKKPFKTFEEYNAAPMVSVGDKIDVINNDLFEGEELEEGCTVEDVVTPNVVVVSLSSDPTIKCNVQWMNGRWEITSDVIEESVTTPYQIIDRAGKMLDQQKPKIGDLTFFVDVPSGHWCWGNKNVTVYASPDYVEDGQLSMGTDTSNGILYLKTPVCSTPEEFCQKYVALVKDNVDKLL
jgi:hypothetical protein